MELEELQEAWTQMGQELEQQKKLTNTIIMQMTQEKYKNKFKKLANYEGVGALICFVLGIIILINFTKLDTWYLITCGVLSLVFLIALPILVLQALYKIKGLNIIKNSYKDNLIHYTKAKNRLLLLEQIGIGCSFLMLFCIVPVTSKIFDNKDVFLEALKTEQLIVLGIMILFLMFFSRWGYRSYKKITNSAANLLEDLK